MGDHPACRLGEDLTILCRKHCMLRNVTQELLDWDEYCGKVTENISVRARNSLRIRGAGARWYAKCIHTSEVKTLRQQNNEKHQIT
jgi:hypothetical protein